jgi:hypothetical protein
MMKQENILFCYVNHQVLPGIWYCRYRTYVPAIGAGRFVAQKGKKIIGRKNDIKGTQD